MDFSITNCLPHVFQSDGNFYQITLSHTLRRIPIKSHIKKFKISSEIGFKQGLKFTIVLIQREIMEII